jgi:hypothetical protein
VLFRSIRALLEKIIGCKHPCSQVRIKPPEIS